MASLQYGMRIEAIAGYAPKNIVTNDMVAQLLLQELQKVQEHRRTHGLGPLSEEEMKKFVTTDRWISRFIGFHERRWDDEGIGTIGLAKRALHVLITQYGLKPSDVDCIVFGTVTPSYLYSPPDSAVLQAALGIPTYDAHGVPIEFDTIDVSRACTTWVSALSIAYMRIRLGISKVVLLIGADSMKTTINFQDRAFACVLADAGTATLCSAVPLEEDWFGINNFWSFTDGSLADIIKTPIGGSLQPVTTLEELINYCNRLWMDGPFVREKMVPFIGGPAIDAAMAKSGWSLGMMDTATFHEANLSMNDAVVKQWRQRGFKGKVLDAGGKFGNTTSASVPLALALNGDQLKEGEYFNWNAFGGGVTAMNAMGQIKHPIKTFVDV